MFVATTKGLLNTAFIVTATTTTGGEVHAVTPDGKVHRLTRNGRAELKDAVAANVPAAPGLNVLHIFVRDNEHTLEAGCLATWAADKFLGENFTQILACRSIGLPVKDPDRPLCVIRHFEEEDEEDEDA